MCAIKGSAAVLTAAFLVLVSQTAQATTVEARVPFPFQVQGQTLPAGRYLVENDGTGVVRIVGERGNRASLFAMTIPASGHDPAGNKPSLTFKRSETVYRLSSIWESGTDGRIITTK
jgi:hypothetical protein